MTGGREGRLGSFSAFWPFYLGEHAHPASRRLHAIGTCGFLLGAAAGLVIEPVRTGIALAVIVGGAALGVLLEPRGGTIVLFLLLVVAAAVASPRVVLPAIAWAYAWAWTGHVVFERNRPATVRYPFWSLVADLRLLARMMKGTSGDS